MTFSPGYPFGTAGGGAIFGGGTTTLVLCGKHQVMHGGVCQNCVTDAVFTNILERFGRVCERMEKALEKLEAPTEG